MVRRIVILGLALLSPVSRASDWGTRLGQKLNEHQALVGFTAGLAVGVVGVGFWANWKIKKINTYPGFVGNTQSRLTANETSIIALGQRVDSWYSIISSQRAQISRQRAQIGLLKTEIAKQQAENQVLRRESATLGYLNIVLGLELKHREADVRRARNEHEIFRSSLPNFVENEQRLKEQLVLSEQDVAYLKKELKELKK